MSDVKARFAKMPVTIVGLGLIGGSIALGLKAAGHKGAITGCVENESDRRQVLELGLVDHATPDMADAVSGAGLVVVAVPIGAMAAVLAELAPSLSREAVVTDVGSTKLSVIAGAQAALGDAIGRFVPAHPISGTERSGLQAGLAGLFAGRRIILTPTPETDADALALVEVLWQTLDGRITAMDAAHHDEVLAATSHLPHVLAFALVDTLARMAEHTEIFEYAAGGFADFTRIASSDPELWSDIVTANRDAVLPVLDRYIGDLDVLRSAIAQADRDKLIASFGRAKAARDQFAQQQTRQG